ncbi:Inactive dipeptidyl peptidase 10 [Liparis tanakae]|uniref:Inactive dipeptidyl peptidase 10 n=1 Tax=Liparis tanakae TaxID=230148 RepID=A0A4Z2GX89_9TELE|nr:Inactive dipeptidyl peptidase 10 [Liparis tanakae]
MGKGRPRSSDLWTSQEAFSSSLILEEGDLPARLRGGSQTDLGSSDGPPRNWKGIGIAMVVILAVMSLVILSVILLTPEPGELLPSASVFTTGSERWLLP